MRIVSRRSAWCVAVGIALTTAGCGGGGNGAAQNLSARGPIKIWVGGTKTDPEAVWGAQMVKAWNRRHPDQKVTAQTVPAGSSSEKVIAAAITAGTTPCLVYGTAPAAVPQFQKQGGLVDISKFPDGNAFIQARTGQRAAQYKSADGDYYQAPWRSNPVMLFYNKDIMRKAGLGSDPKLQTWDELLTVARQVVKSHAARAALWLSTSTDYYQPWFDYYPLFLAQTGGTKFIQDGRPMFDSPGGLEVADMMRTLYAQGLAPKEQAQADPFGTGQAAMALVGPWAITAYSDIHWGVVPVPTKDGARAAQIHTFADQKSVGMYTSCKKLGTAWAFIKFTMDKENDGKWLEETGQMPMRANVPAVYAGYFGTHPAYRLFARQADRSVEVPIVVNSIELWQRFRNAYLDSVVFGRQPVDTAFKAAAGDIEKLVQG